MGYQMDFVKDFNEFSKKWLEANNIQIHTKDNDYILEFLRWYKLYISPTPREVYISNELKNSDNFDKYKKEIDLIKNTFEKGGDIMPFTSARKGNVKRNPYNDALLNNWHIHHFHLNVEKDKNVGSIQLKRLISYHF